MANYFQISPTLVFSYRLSFSPTAEISRLEIKFEESSPWKTASILKEGIGQESNGAANQEKQIFLLCQAPVVQRLDNAIHRINHYPADSAVCFVNNYPLDSDLSGG